MLAGLLRESRGPLVATFQRFYGGTPERLAAAGVGARDMASMARYAPRESALIAALDPAGNRWWTPDTYLLALIADTLALANWQRGGGKGARPRRIPRPKEPNDTEVLKGDVFDSIEEFEEWYAAQFPPSEDAPSTVGHPTSETATNPAGPDTILQVLPPVEA